MLLFKPPGLTKFTRYKMQPTFPKSGRSLSWALFLVSLLAPDPEAPSLATVGHATLWCPIDNDLIKKGEQGRYLLEIECFFF
jgi:hypothetical protein